jgi:hypothetical protein
LSASAEVANVNARAEIEHTKRRRMEFSDFDCTVRATQANAGFLPDIKPPLMDVLGFHSRIM